MTDPAVTDWRWWRERRLPAGPLHLDTAAAGRSVDCTAEDLDRLRQALLALG